MENSRAQTVVGDGARFTYISLWVIRTPLNRELFCVALSAARSCAPIIVMCTYMWRSAKQAAAPHSVHQLNDKRFICVAAVVVVVVFGQQAYTMAFKMDVCAF